MTTSTQPIEVTVTPAPSEDISNPDLSFSDYERLRREGKTSDSSKMSAPEEKSSEQKKTSESDTEKTDGKAKDSEDDSDDSEESDELEKEKPKKKSGFKRKIDKLIARVSDRDREIEYLKSQAQNGKSAIEPKQESKIEAKSDDGEPDAGDFDTHSEYVKAIAKWTLNQDKKAAKQEEDKSKLLTEYQKRIQSHTEREKSFSEKSPDYKEVLEEIDDVIFPAAAIQVITESNLGPELIYELAKNREEAVRIAGLNPLASAYEIGKLEAKISAKSSAETKTETKKITTAPKPIEPVGGSKGTVSKSITDPNISFSDYEKLRRQQMKRR